MTNPITSNGSSGIKTDEAPLPSTVWGNRSVTILKASAVALVVGVALTFAPLTLPLVAGASIIFAIGLAILSASGALTFAAVVSDKRAQTLAIGEWKPPFYQITKEEETAKRRILIDKVRVAGNTAVAQSQFEETCRKVFGSYSTEGSTQTAESHTPSRQRELSKADKKAIADLEAERANIDNSYKKLRDRFEEEVRVKSRLTQEQRTFFFNNPDIRKHDFTKISSTEELRQKRGEYLKKNEEYRKNQSANRQEERREHTKIQTEIAEQKSKLSEILISEFEKHITNTILKRAHSTILNTQLHATLVAEFTRQLSFILHSSEQQETYCSEQEISFSNTEAIKNALILRLFNANCEGKWQAADRLRQEMEEFTRVVEELKTKYEFSKKLSEDEDLQRELAKLRINQNREKQLEKSIQNNDATIHRNFQLQNEEIEASFKIREQEILIAELELKSDKMCAENQQKIREIEKKIAEIRRSGVPTTKQREPQEPQTPTTDFLHFSEARSDSTSSTGGRVLDGEVKSEDVQSEDDEYSQGALSQPPPSAL
jgi:hypothetical protein